MINDKVIFRARRPTLRTRRVQTRKMMHKWLPINKMRGHVTGLS